MADAPSVLLCKLGRANYRNTSRKSLNRINRTIGEKSKPPVAGKILRMGASIGSVSARQNLTIGWSNGNCTQESTTVASTIRE